jgi:hypothetical protein
VNAGGRDSGATIAVSSTVDAAAFAPAEADAAVFDVKAGAVMAGWKMGLEAARPTVGKVTGGLAFEALPIKPRYLENPDVRGAASSSSAVDEAREVVDMALETGPLVRSEGTPTSSFALSDLSGTASRALRLAEDRREELLGKVDSNGDPWTLPGFDNAGTAKTDADRTALPFFLEMSAVTALALFEGAMDGGGLVIEEACCESIGWDEMDVPKVVEWDEEDAKEALLSERFRGFSLVDSASVLMLLGPLKTPAAHP